MIPVATDLRWKQLLLGDASYEFKTATAGMLFGRLRRSMIADPSPANYAVCLQQASAFLTKYERLMQDDIEAIFGHGGKK
ncbi:MAG TPA: hypothetical protein VIV60_17230 [Polyangiaceae bacterium]